ncbi:MAG: AAA family ATPase [Chloroflexi bacterium]|nr:AAA family ATPase [Chloroflexota bacterium]
MTKTIAVAGKGGTGKTTISALLVKLLSENGVVLAIDADPSANLNIALGLPLNDTIGNVREEMMAAVRGNRLGMGIAKQNYLELKLSEALVESRQLDLLAMGRPEGKGCYCAINNMLRDVVDRLGKNYDFIVLDSEAGMEHISRQTTRDVDFLLIVSDPTIRGIITAARIKDLIKELRTQVGRVALVVNRTRNGLSPEIQKAIDASGLELAVSIPEDPEVLELEAKGVPVAELPPTAAASRAVADLVRKLGIA